MQILARSGGRHRLTHPEEISMTAETSMKRWRPLFAAIFAIGVAVVLLSLPQGRGLVGQFFRSLRVQKVQAVNVDLSSFTDPNANPALHEMVAKMISDKVVVTMSEKDQSAPDRIAAAQIAGFPVELLSSRKDAPKFDVSGEHDINLKVDRARLQAIFNEAGHTELVVPQSLDGASVAVHIPRAVQVQYGNCPTPTTATNAVASNITGPTPATTEFSDCVRLREGPSPIVNVPPGLDVEHLAQIGLEVAGMSPTQSHDFLQTVDWKSTLSMTVPRFLRSYQGVKVDGVQGTLLTLAGRRGPGYTLIWTKNGTVYSLVGFGDSSEAVDLANSLK
jgi:hypothetical protein